MHCLVHNYDQVHTYDQVHNYDHVHNYDLVHNYDQVHNYTTCNVYNINLTFFLKNQQQRDNNSYVSGNYFAIKMPKTCSFYFHIMLTEQVSVVGE